MWYIALFLVFLAADQAVKLWVVQHLALYESAPLLPGFLELRYIQNTGGGWSILSDYTWLLSILTAFIMLVLLYLLLRRIVRHPLGRTACVLLLAGGCGNLIDRLRLGYVVDMFNFQFISYPVFNVADIAVVIGMILAAVYYLFLYEKYDGPERGERHGDAASRQ
jgi:signal peptidase II